MSLEPRRSLALLAALATFSAGGAACSSADAAGPGATNPTGGGRADGGPHDAGTIPPSGDASVSEASVPSVRDGALVGGPGTAPGSIAGIDYVSGSERGTTDAAGKFRYVEGATITFSIAGVELATVPAKAVLSPFALAGAGCSYDAALTRVLVTLETLDSDQKSDNGFALSTYPPKANETRKLSGMSDAEHVAWLASLEAGRTPPDGALVLSKFVLRVEDEAWTKTDETAFDTASSATRSQGVAWDGSGFVFSWTLGLQRTDANLSTVVNRTAAIPLDMLIAGSNHIGDIDVYGGTLYAPVEDGSKYENPTIVVYDAQSLDPKGARFELPTSLLTKGVPWVAVDGPAGVAYVAEWDPTPSLFVFDLATFSHQKTITLSQTLGRIQGGKVLEGSLYAASDDDQKTVYKIHLATGIVMPALFSYGASVVKELEGLAAIPESGTNAASLRVLGVDANGSSVTFRTHSRSRAPLRREWCM